MAEVTKEEAAASTTKLSRQSIKYRCVRNCYWNNQCFNDGDIVTIPSTVKVPEYFVKVN